jgi:hypothetical protein
LLGQIAACLPHFLPVMTKRYLSLFVGLLLASTSYAQQPWQPFRPGLTYQYHETTPSDVTHVLRLAGAGTVVAGAPAGTAPDTLYRFPSMVRPMNTSIGCSTSQRELPDNLFGATLRGQARSVFVLGSPNGRTLTLRPRYAVGQSWPTGLPGLTASVSSRTMQQVLGGAADSVVAIQFSNGQSLHLSKRHGLLDGPSLDSYLNGLYARRALTLSSIPERGLGSPLTGPHAVYNFQPGDVFQHTNVTACGVNYQQDSMLTRQASRTGDTLTYTMKTWLVVSNSGGRYCTAPPSTTYSTSFTTLRVSSATTPNVLTSYVSGIGYTQPVSSDVAQFGGRPTYYVYAATKCPYMSADSAGLGGVNGYVYDRYGTGLGLVYHIYNTSAGGAPYLESSTLTAFRKGSQSWGTFFRPTAPLAARSGQAAATTTAFPNPFSDGLTVGFTLASPQAIGISLRDALGREVRTVPAVPLGAGVQQLPVLTAGLPAAVYTLHLHFASEARSEVLKVVKTN